MPQFAVSTALAGALLSVVMLVPAEAAPWNAPPQGYTYRAAGPCAETKGKTPALERPGQARYDVCADQMALFAKGLDDARRQGKLLLVKFGATWCPWCAQLQRHIQTADVLARKGEALDYGAAFHLIEIGLSTVYKGQKAAIPSGEDVLGQVLRRTPGVTIRAIPFLAVIDPNDDSRLVARNLDDISNLSSGTLNFDRMREILRELHASVRTGIPAAAEPTWIWRKITRWWNG